MYVLVGADTSSFEGLGTQLFVLVRHHVHAKWELVDIGTLSSKIEDTNLRVWHTTVESRFGIRLRELVQEYRTGVAEYADLVLAVAVASSWSSGHFDEV